MGIALVLCSVSNRRNIPAKRVPHIMVPNVIHVRHSGFNRNLIFVLQLIAEQAE